MDVKDIIKNRRIMLGLTMKELSEKVGVSEGTISRWESGEIINMRRDKIVALSEALHLSPAVIMGWEPIDIISSYKYSYRIPVLATVAAGQPIYSEDSILEWIDYDKDPKDNVFGLRVRGDSMMPRIRDGDIIIVDRSLAWDDNDIVVITVNGNDGCCKRIRRYADGIMLLSLNPSYEPIYYSKEQVEQLPIRVLGKVIESRSRF